jgi:hypothetical protein
MEKEALKRIFEFLEEKEEQNPPFIWKFKNNIPLAEEDLNIEGDLDLHSWKKLTSLPKGLKVGGSLSLVFADIESLPEGLKVGDNLYLQRSKITSLPKGLEVKGELIIKNTALLEYTDKELKDMVKPGFIKGEIIREW